MAYQGVIDDFMRCIGLRPADRMPIVALTEEFDVGQAGLTYEQYGASGENVARVHINAVDTFGYDWACIYIDDCIEFEPLGVTSVGSGNIPKSASKFVPATREALHRLRVPDPLRDGRMPILLDGIRAVRRQFGDSVLICGRSPAPFSAATLLFGVEAAIMLIYDDPELLGDAMHFLMDVEETYARAQIEAGAHALWVGDCSASSRFLSLPHFREFAFDDASEHLARLRQLEAITIYFAAEKDVRHVEVAADLGADIISLSENADLAACCRAAGDKVCLMGNLDPINVLMNGDAETVGAEVRRTISSADSGCAYLFNTGEGVPLATPPRNVEAMIEAVREWR